MNIAYDLPDADGVTDKQRNLELSHLIPLGTLVEVNASCCEEHGCRLFVVSHDRDCDGTPLYGLSFNPKAYEEYEELMLERTNYNGLEMMTALISNSINRAQGSITCGFSGECLVMIERTMS